MISYVHILNCFFPLLIWPYVNLLLVQPSQGKKGRGRKFPSQTVSIKERHPGLVHCVDLC